MSEQRIRVYRDGKRVAFADIIEDPDFSGVLRRTLIDPQDAIDIGGAMAAIGREILAEAKP